RAEGGRIREEMGPVDRGGWRRALVGYARPRKYLGRNQGCRRNGLGPHGRTATIPSRQGRRSCLPICHDRGTDLVRLILWAGWGFHQQLRAGRIVRIV